MIASFEEGGEHSLHETDTLKNALWSPVRPTGIDPSKVRGKHTDIQPRHPWGTTYWTCLNRNFPGESQKLSSRSTALFRRSTMLYNYIPSAPN